MKATTSYGYRGYSKSQDRNTRENNAHCTTFRVIKDPSGLYTEGVSVLRIIDMQYGIRDGVFEDGIVFETEGRRVRVDRGKLVFSENRSLYPLPPVHF